MTILVADHIADVGIETLKRAGHEVVEQPTLAHDELLEALSSHTPQVLVVRSTRVTAEALDASPHLSLIVRAGAGYDTIDVDGASSRGIFVANCPGKNSVAVAELTIGLILALDRRIPDNVVEARAGHWNKKAFAQAAGIKNRRLGVIGIGSIGEEVIRRAHAFDLKVIAWSRSLTREDADRMGVGWRSTPMEVAADADIVTLHVAATPDTKHLANRAFFEAMSDGALFINTTRASVVDEEALAWAVDIKDLRVGLDVMVGEPSQKEGDFAHPLAGHPNVYMTHHIGASTQQAQNATAQEAARVVTTYDETGSVPNCVNLATQTPATHQITVRHRDKVGVLAAVLDEMRRVGWNIQEMDNLIFEGAQAASASIRFVGEPDDETLRRIENHDDVFAVTMIKL
jgi:D-3-phosphoglycerate dehydrogenase